MGIDYYACSACGEGFPDVMDYARCEVCNSMLCERCMNQYGVSHGMANAEMVNEDGEDEYDLCPFCSDEIITDEVLLAYALRLLKMSKGKLEKKYRGEAS